MSKQNGIKKHIKSLNKKQKITAVAVLVVSAVLAVVFALFTVELILN